MIREDLSNKHFGRLTVLSFDHSDIHGHSYWLCRCDCGEHTIVMSNNLKAGTTTSCGCYRREKIRETFTIHGLYNSRIYKTWISIRKRCNNKKAANYHLYGGRGIKVCDEWNDNFNTFYNWCLNHGYKEDLIIDRINNNGDYEPDNCRWVDAITQSNNKRNNRRITYNNETHTLAEWGRILKIHPDTLGKRLNKNDYSVFKERYDNEY